MTPKPHAPNIGPHVLKPRLTLFAWLLLGLLAAPLTPLAGMAHADGAPPIKGNTGG